MRARFIALVACGALGLAASASAQSGRPDVLWARFTTPGAITLNGLLTEPEWAMAESVVIRFGHIIDLVPGSGYKFEGGTLPNDSTYATIKVLADGNQFYMGAVVRDKSIGGSEQFNRFDGFLMAIKDHAAGGHPAPPAEYFYSWWSSGTPDPQPPGQGPAFVGRWAEFPPGTPRTPEQIANWDAVTVVTGTTNSDPGPDSRWVTEMRFNLAPMGYNITQTHGDIVEWNISVYDCDWFWPLVPAFSSNRAWYQGPWGNSAAWNEVRLYARPDVTVSSGAVPAESLAPELRIPNAAAYPTPVIDGVLDEAVWSIAPRFQIQYGNDAIRDAYPGLLKWRAGQFQPNVNGGAQLVQDANLATVKYFFKNDSLYFGFDVQDLYVGYVAAFDRWDGAVVSLQHRVDRELLDHTLLGKRLSFQVNAAGQAQANDDLPSLTRSKVALQLKPNTTVDTLGLDFDEGWTAEMKIDLTQLGYPAGLGDHIVFLGLNLLDGDSVTPFTDSYSTRTWWAREYESTCCPPWGYLDPSFSVAVEDKASEPTRFALHGAYPNPARFSTLLRYSVPVASRAALRVYDVRGRLVASRDLGVQSPGMRQTFLSRDGLWPGLYLYRLHLSDPTSGAARAALAGKVVFLK